MIPNGSLDGLLDWVKVCVTNTSEVELHMLDRELLSAFAVFLGNLPRKDELTALVGWCMVYSIMQVLEAEGSTIGEVSRKVSPGGKVWHPTGLLPSVQAIHDGHSHLERWSVEVGKREARECLAAIPYETVTSYCFCKWWLDSKKQDWWPTSRGPLKQAFGVHPTKASEMGLTHRIQILVSVLTFNPCLMKPKTVLIINILLESLLIFDVILLFKHFPPQPFSQCRN